MHRGLKVFLAIAFLFTWVGGTHAAMIVLDSADANGIGDGGGSPFLFSFSSNAPGFEGVLLEFLDYDALGIAITDDNGFVVLPLIEFSPATNILFSFLGTTGNYTAHVVGVGGGAFGLEITAVPVPSSGVLFGSALMVLVGFQRFRKKRSRDVILA